MALVRNMDGPLTPKQQTVVFTVLPLSETNFQPLKDLFKSDFADVSLERECILLFNCNVTQIRSWEVRLIVIGLG